MTLHQFPRRFLTRSRLRPQNKSTYVRNAVSYAYYTALQAATILVAMASEKNIWRPKFWRKSPIGDQQIKKETYLKNYQ